LLLPNLAASHQHRVWNSRQRDSTGAGIVRGDTLTAYSAARAARDMGYPIAHLEAGLRTDAMLEPFPEEWFRRRIARFAQIHFAPSRSAVENLLTEGIDDRAVHHVGNTGIDSLRQVLEKSEHGHRRRRRVRSTVLVTLHRRANYDRNAAIVCDALIGLASARQDLRILFPVHPNPRVSATVRRRLESHPSIDLVEPMRYQQFVDCAERAALIISDSGGIQEEAPHLGTPAGSVQYGTSESIVTGFVRLVPIDRDTICALLWTRWRRPAARLADRRTRAVRRATRAEGRRPRDDTAVAGLRVNAGSALPVRMHRHRNRPRPRSTLRHKRLHRG
jgi:UDP-N-acetylglucosamine 2-epimerase (non-hydrolysing)